MNERFYTEDVGEQKMGTTSLMDGKYLGQEYVCEIPEEAANPLLVILNTLNNDIEELRKDVDKQDRRLERIEAELKSLG